MAEVVFKLECILSKERENKDSIVNEERFLYKLRAFFTGKVDIMLDREVANKLSVIPGVAVRSNSVMSGVAPGNESVMSGVVVGRNSVMLGGAVRSKSVMPGVAVGSNSVMSGVAVGSESVMSGVAVGRKSKALGIAVRRSKSVMSGVAVGSKSVMPDVAVGSNSVMSGVAIGSESVMSGVAVGSKSVMPGVAIGSNSVMSSVAVGRKSVMLGAAVRRSKFVMSGVAVGSKSVKQDGKVVSKSVLVSATNDFKDMERSPTSYKSVYKGWVDEKSYGPTESGVGLAIYVRKEEILTWKLDLKLLEFSHPNITRLLGYCLSNVTMFWVYELFPGICLDDLLFKDTTILSWAARLKIAQGAAQGMSFFHRRNRPAYNSFDGNHVLVDRDFNARLSDYEIDNLLAPPGCSTFERNKSDGIFGPVPGDETGVQSEIYDFGVVLLKMLTGMKKYDERIPLQQKNLMEWATPLLANKVNLWNDYGPSTST